MSASQSSGLVSTNFFSVKPDVGMPALFTRMSTGPVSSRMRRILVGLVTSAFTGTALLGPAELLRDLGRALLVDVVDVDERAGVDERATDRGTHTVAAAGHERALDLRS